MSEFLKDKPSSRVLRPPGGASSNIFGGSDECTEQSRVVKPTSVKSSNIFAMGTENVTQNSPVKVSKTHQSSIFADSEKTSNPGKTESRISNIPMFTQTGPEELKRPVRRPITAPSCISPCFSTQSSLDTRNPVGQRKKVLAGFKPANANLMSTVFGSAKTNALKGRKHFIEPCILAETMSSSSETHFPIVAGESIYVERTTSAELALKDRQASAYDKQHRQPNTRSKTYLSVAFNPPHEGIESPVYATDGSTLNFNKKVHGSGNESTVFQTCPQNRDPPKALSLSQIPLPWFMRDPVNESDGLQEDSKLTSCYEKDAAQLRTTSSLHLRRSTIFDDNSPQQHDIWSSGFNMSSRRPRKSMIPVSSGSDVFPTNESLSHDHAHIGLDDVNFEAVRSVPDGSNL